MPRRIDTEAIINWIRLAQQSGNPASPDSGYWSLFVKSDGLYIKNSAGTVYGPIDGVETFTFGFQVPGDLTAGAVSVRLPAPYTGTITNVTASCFTAPTGAAAIVDVNKAGTTIFTTQGNRPTIADGANDDLSSVPDVTAVTQNDIFTIDIDQIGSTTPGKDLHVQIRGIKA
jgi:hypothetical protein